jgi:predicted NBD/HSP70 family sugar kinase
LIGRVLCDLVRILDPEKIIIGGAILRAFPQYLEYVRAAYVEEQPTFAVEYPDILPSLLEENSVALGASVLVSSQYFRAFESGRGMPSDTPE